MIRASACLAQDERQRFSWLGSWKRTCLKNAHSLRGKPGGIKVNGFYSDLLYQPWFCSSVEIQPAWLEVDNIDRCVPPHCSLYMHAVPLIKVCSQFQL